MNKRVVIISYYFPPLGGAGTQRFAKFCRHLPALGWDPIVVAADSDMADPSTIRADNTLVADLPAGMHITRLPSIKSRTGKTPRSASLKPSSRVFPPAEVEWAGDAAAHAIALARDHDASAIVVTVSPYACARTIPRLKKAGVPVILDLRDPWALDGWRHFRTSVQANIDARAMRSALRAADHVIANCDEAAHAYATFAGLDSHSLSVITNGWCEHDFSPVTPIPRPDAHDVFRLLHVGTLHDPTDERTDRCTRVPVERHTRSGRYLLQAVHRLIRQHPSLLSRLRIEFAGHVDPAHTPLIEKLGLGGIVREYGYVNHDDAAGLLDDAHAVFVPMHQPCDGSPATAVPGKLYEALASGRPILGAMPAGDARRIVENANAGCVVSPNDDRSMTMILTHWINAWLQGRAVSGAHRRDIEQFERGSLTRQLSTLLDQLTTSSNAAIRDSFRQSKAA